MGIREIIFRGKQLDNGKWIYGWYSEACFGSWPLLPAIVPMDDARSGYRRDIEIDPTTLGQYTGLTDKNGKRIFEGDIVKVKYTFNGEDCEEIKPVTYDPKNGGYVPFTWEYQCDGCDCEVTIVETEIIGNIHDNKEFDAQNGEEKEE